MNSTLRLQDYRYWHRVTVIDMTTKFDVIDYWDALHSQQSDWAFRAYERLVNSLSADVQERLLIREGAAEPYVVIFGKTQVGKTTLLLDLLGIDFQHMEGISRVLRGGREAGKSATATVMEYRRSYDNRWGISVNNETRWYTSDDEVTRTLGKLRTRMEAGELTVTVPCIVYIPWRCFALHYTKAHSVRILDLPGDNPGHVEEQNHVSLMAKTWLPFADLVLLVGRGDDLGFLQPDAISLPGIEDWQSMPHKFRIVTTYSYSAQTIRDFIRNDPHFGIDELRSRLISQIECFGSLSDAAKDENLFFPMEFGASWKSIERSEPDLYTRIAPLVDGLRTELMAEITSSTTSIGRLRNMLNTHLSVEYIQKKKTQVINRDLFRLKQKRVLAMRDIATCTAVIKTTTKTVENIAGLLSTSLTQTICNRVEEVVSATVFVPLEPSGIESCSALRQLISGYYDGLKTIYLNLSGQEPYWTSLRKNMTPPGLIEIDDILNDAFSNIRHTLNDYSTDSYWDWLFGNYKKDLQRVHNSAHVAHTLLINCWKACWETAAERIEADYSTQLNSEQTKLELFCEELSGYSKLRNRLDKDIYAAIEERDAIELRARQDLHRCRKFFDLLNEEYHSTLSERFDAILHAEDDCESLLQLFSCVNLQLYRQDLMNLTENPQAKQ